MTAVRSPLASRRAPRRTVGTKTSADKVAASLRDEAPPTGSAKGRQTRQAIVDCALQMAGRIGLEGLSIGVLADRMEMSKSGVFAHFGSREELQIAVIRHYHDLFEQEVFYRAIEQPRGIPRLATMVQRWLQRVSVEMETGCIYISSAVEFDDRPGTVRDALVAMIQTWHDAVRRAIAQAIEVGHLKPDTDPQQLMFQIHGYILALHHDARLLKLPNSLTLACRSLDALLRDRATPEGLPLLLPCLSQDLAANDADHH
ncbi:TetR/AcrR family transcriptional regulator [Thiomonas bhubaneswarensis]|uniref:Transcriptional regulator, TetR family n=1 Tax=Thiomonas bhubaneswarensis TaxID=339866 RepID=A0A0K6HQ94_9BURK|nr:TetR/AcrR family transcriptional regulator [Thiomonas bhubaneswarensis]CUA93197.1 transcriptional regulator, TetR family [Thiomonas bhubaneswarensis]